MIDTYIENKNQKKEKEDLRQEILFGQVTGLIITIVAFLHFLSTTNKVDEVIMKIFMIMGTIFFVTGIVFPYALYYPSKWIKAFINKVFQGLLIGILTIIYIVFVLPIGLIYRKKWRKEYEFFSWNSTNQKLKERGFRKRKNSDEEEIDEIKRNNKIKSVTKIVGYFIEKKQFILIPILCTLILLGFLFFFVTSSVVTPMIYTLF